MSGWRLRRSRPDDAPALHMVWRRSVEATHGFLGAGELEVISLQVRQDYLPGADLLVAVDGEDRPIGFMGLAEREIDCLFIAPAWRGRGLGRAFVEAAGRGRLEVSVNEQNSLAVGFYEAMGFIPYARTATDGEGRPYPLLKMRREPI